MYSNIRYKPLPDNLFLVRVPIIATYSEAEITHLGLPLNMINGKPDHTTYQTMTPVYLKLDKIIDIYISGYPIRLVNTSDIETIYTILDKYVRALNDNDNFELNTAGVVEDRLYDIERFAAEIFDHNKISILKQLIRGKNGYDAKVDIMPLFNSPQQTYNAPRYQEVIDSSHNHMEGYTTMGSGGYGLNTFAQEDRPRYTNNGSARDAFRFNPNKQELSNRAYINNNLPDIDFSKATRNRTQIRIQK